MGKTVANQNVIYFAVDDDTRILTLKKELNDSDEIYIAGLCDIICKKDGSDFILTDPYNSPQEYKTSVIYKKIKLSEAEVLLDKIELFLAQFNVALDANSSTRNQKLLEFLITHNWIKVKSGADYTQYLPNIQYMTGQYQSMKQMILDFVKVYPDIYEVGDTMFMPIFKLDSASSPDECIDLRYNIAIPIKSGESLSIVSNFFEETQIANGIPNGTDPHDDKQNPTVSSVNVQASNLTSLFLSTSDKKYLLLNNVETPGVDELTAVSDDSRKVFSLYEKDQTPDSDMSVTAAELFGNTTVLLPISITCKK